MGAYNLITILGPTATGKTSVAAHLANQINGEVISADSRQVYRGMSIGTGKDIEDYFIDGQCVPYHLIDIVDAGYQYNVYEYQRDFLNVYDNILQRNKMPILCGGSGMYIEAVLKGYKLINVPVNNDLRQSLAKKNLPELREKLSQYKKLHNTTDVDTIKRAIRAIEIEEFYLENPETNTDYPNINSLIIGIDVDREIRRKRISKRLKTRLNNGMIDEVKSLMNTGLSPDELIYYGLEYKYITQHLIGELNYNEMFKQLETAIHQFAKRQMTWFRRMEKQGFAINWIDGKLTIDEKVQQIIGLIS